jgi:cupin 2 domain-containing protein
MSSIIHNIFANVPLDLSEEQCEPLAASAAVRIERIISHGHASPDGFWYDQLRQEFVVLLQGAANIRFEGVAELAELVPGDYISIPAHTRHRVEWTTPDGPTVWLAVHFSE